MLTWQVIQKHNESIYLCFYPEFLSIKKVEIPHMKFGESNVSKLFLAKLELFMIRISQ
jgi:hypothetical protein